MIGYVRNKGIMKTIRPFSMEGMLHTIFTGIIKPKSYTKCETLLPAIRYQNARRDIPNNTDDKWTTTGVYGFDYADLRQWQNP